MGILQVIVNEDPQYPIADAILREDLPRFDDCDPDEHASFASEIRWALTQKVRQMILMHAFREAPDGDDVDLKTLCSEAEVKVLNPSFVAEAQDFVLRDLGITDQREVHPIPEVVERETALACGRILRALGPLLSA